MTVTETNFVWFLVGNVILIYVAAYAFDVIANKANKVWFWYVDRVLEAQQESKRLDFHQADTTEDWLQAGSAGSRASRSAGSQERSYNHDLITDAR